MKLRLRVMGIFLIALTSLVLLGCSKTGQKAVENNIKTLFPEGTVIETTNYSYNEKSHVAKIQFKTTKPAEAPKEHTLDYAVISDDYVHRLPLYTVPKSFREDLLKVKPDMFVESITAYAQLYTLQKKLYYIAQFMDIKISAAKLNQESWESVYDCASLANIVIEMYEKAYDDAPPIVADKFAKPLAPFDLTTDPAYYKRYVATDLSFWVDDFRKKDKEYTDSLLPKP